MDTATIYTKLHDVFAETFDDPVDLTPELTAEEVDGWDSITHIRLVLSIERAFSIRFSAGEVGEPKNVGELVELIEKKL